MKKAGWCWLWLVRVDKKYRTKKESSFAKIQFWCKINKNKSANSLSNPTVTFEGVKNDEFTLMPYAKLI